MGEAEWERQSGRDRVGKEEWVRQSGRGRVGEAEWERQNGRGIVGEAEEGGRTLWLKYCRLVNSELTLSNDRLKIWDRNRHCQIIG